MFDSVKRKFGYSSLINTAIVKQSLLAVLSVVILITTAGATAIVTSGNSTLQALNPTANDTVIVASGHTVTVSGNWHAGNSDVTCLVMYIREGGTLQFAGSSRANFGAIWLGGISSSPFSSYNGGHLVMTANDTLGLWNTNRLGSNDFSFRGPNCLIDIDGGSSSTKAVIMGMSASDRPHIAGTATDGTFNVSYAKFYRLGSGTDTPGLTLGGSSSLRPHAVQNIESSVFDSACVCFYGTYAKVLQSCSVYVNIDWPYSGLYLYGIRDSVVNTLVEHDNRYNSYAHGGYMTVRIYADSTVLHSTTVKNVNGNGESGRADYGVRLYGDYIHMVRDTVDGFVWGINSNGSHDITIDSSVVIYCTHEGVLRIENNGDSAWVFRGNTFYGNGHEVNSGYSDVLINLGPDDPAYLDYQFLYNTFCSRDAGDIPLSYRNHSGGSVSASGITMVGNIFVGYDKDVRIANYGGATTHITCNEFKYNAFDNLVIESGCSFNIAGGEYNWADSNLHNQTNYGFVDSAAFDFRLDTESPLLGAGETYYGSQIFSGSGPFSIGCWQSLLILDTDPDDNNLPGNYHLHQNYPNPFNPITSIRFDMPRNAFVNISVYNILGRKVRTLANDQFSVGEHVVTWDGTNDENRPVASGVYLYRIAADGVTESRRMVLLR